VYQKCEKDALLSVIIDKLIILIFVDYCIALSTSFFYCNCNDFTKPPDVTSALAVDEVVICVWGGGEGRRSCLRYGSGSKYPMGWGTLPR
jgi:hypothetical protein